MFVCCECCVLSGRGLCNRLITHPEESYWLWHVIVCYLETSWMRKPWSNGDCYTKTKQITKHDKFNGSTFTQIQISAQRFAVWQVLCGLNVLLQVNSRVVPQIRMWPVFFDIISKSLFICHNTIWCCVFWAADHIIKSTKYRCTILNVVHIQRLFFLCSILNEMYIQYNQNFTFLWGQPKNWLRSKERCSYRHLAGTIQKVCKIAENPKCGNVKLGYLLYICIRKLTSHCSSACHHISLDKTINVSYNQIFLH